MGWALFPRYVIGTGIFDRYLFSSNTEAWSSFAVVVGAMSFLGVPLKTLKLEKAPCPYFLLEETIHVVIRTFDFGYETFTTFIETFK